VNARTRLLLCLVSVLLAVATIAMTGGWKNTARSMQGLYFGVLGTFLILYALALLAITSTTFARSLWLIPVAAFVAYPVTTLAYFGYLAVFERDALFRALEHIQPLRLVAMTFIGIPTASLAWLFGALAGTVFIVLGRRFGVTPPP
jgi:hypothetical protein